MADFVLAGDFRKGVTFEMDGKVVTIVDFLHVKPGKGAAFVRTKLRDVINGGTVEMTFNPTAKFQTAHIEHKNMIYSYNDGDLYYFMDPVSFDMLPINSESVEDALKYVMENGEVTVSFYNGSPFAVEPPNFVELLITHCEPGAKGNTTQGATKPATLETGYTLQVPLFVNEGDTIRVDTRTGTYMSRV
ncbi:MAG: elongation factor P [Clostridia bacterium]|nr:elongation factor P [Clostridia bacterium]